MDGGCPESYPLLSERRSEYVRTSAYRLEEKAQLVTNSNQLVPNWEQLAETCIKKATRALPEVYIKTMKYRTSNCKNCK